MTTYHNLKELNNLVPVASAKQVKNGRSVCVRVEEELIIYPNNVQEYDTDINSFCSAVNELIWLEYEGTIIKTRRNINRIFVHLYEKPLEVPENKITDLSIKIKKLMQNTNATLDQMATAIRNYLGYKCSFYRDDTKKVRVDSNRLQNAFKLVKERKSITLVEDALYF